MGEEPVIILPRGPCVRDAVYADRPFLYSWANWRQKNGKNSCVAYFITRNTPLTTEHAHREGRNPMRAAHKLMARAWQLQNRDSEENFRLLDQTIQWLLMRWGSEILLVPNAMQRYYKLAKLRLDNFTDLMKLLQLHWFCKQTFPFHDVKLRVDQYAQILNVKF